MDPSSNFLYKGDGGSRRGFFLATANLGVASSVFAHRLGGRATVPDNLQPLLDAPSSVFVEQDVRSGFRKADRRDKRFTHNGAVITIAQTNSGQDVRASSPDSPLRRVILRWEVSFARETLFLGDAWERSYGDLQWRFLQPERIMPWYFAAYRNEAGLFAIGVKTQPSALCCWLVDGEGVSLWLDFRNGGSPVLAGDREIRAATIVALQAPRDQTPASALRDFCSLLCTTPRLPKAPICGNNNWYYAYGRDFDAAAMVRDAHFLAELAEGNRNRPFCVVDAGWTSGSVCPGGPWRSGDPRRFPDMPGLAQKMVELGVRPGIWVRPTALTVVDNPARLRKGPIHAEEKPLDLTIPDNLSLIHDDVARIRSWGYELIKHDFSTYDIFGRWGFEMGAEMTDPGWRFQDQSLTNAEIILRLYKTLRAAADDALLLGCNTVGHIGAGLFEANRTGDDTSGHNWERTRRMGVNTLAYRICQNGAFFACDPDCAAHTSLTPWDLDQQYLELVSKSGAVLFISADPRTIMADQKTIFQKAMQTALSSSSFSSCEPIDWLHSTSPKTWRFGEKEKQFRWETASGVNPLGV